MAYALLTAALVCAGGAMVVWAVASWCAWTEVVRQRKAYDRAVRRAARGAER